MHDPHGHGDEHDDPHHQHHFTTMEQQFDTSKIGMWLFLATEVLLFGGLFVGFGMMQARFPQEFMEAHEHLQRPLGALNTVVLLFSSWTMVMGVLSASTNQRKKLVMYPDASPSSAPASSWASKYFEYSHKYEEGLLPGHYYTHHGDQDSDRAQPRLRDLLQLLFHDDRPARHPHPGRHRAAGLDRDPRQSRRVSRMPITRPSTWSACTGTWSI